MDGGIPVGAGLWRKLGPFCFVPQGKNLKPAFISLPGLITSVLPLDNFVGPIGLIRPKDAQSYRSGDQIGYLKSGRDRSLVSHHDRGRSVLASPDIRSSQPSKLPLELGILALPALLEDEMREFSS